MMMVSAYYLQLVSKMRFLNSNILQRTRKIEVSGVVVESIIFCSLVDVM